MGGFRFLTAGYRRLAYPERHVGVAREAGASPRGSTRPTSENPSPPSPEATAICGYCREEVAIDNSQPTFVHVLCGSGGDPFPGPIAQTNPTYGRASRTHGADQEPISASAPVGAVSTRGEVAAPAPTARVNRMLRVGALLSIVGSIIIASAWPYTTYDTSQTPVVPIQHGSLGATGFGGLLLGVGQLFLLVGVIAYGIVLGLRTHRDLEESARRTGQQHLTRD